MSSGRVSSIAYKAGFVQPWRSHYLVRSRAFLSFFIRGLIERRILGAFISVRRVRSAARSPLGLRLRFYAPVWQPVRVSRATTFATVSGLCFSSLYVTNWQRLPRRGVYRRVEDSLLEASFLRPVRSGRKGRSWFSRQQELIMPKVRPLRHFVFRLGRYFRRLSAQNALSSLFLLPVHATVLGVQGGLPYRSVLWSAFTVLQVRSRRSFGRRFGLLVLCLAAGVFWQDMELLVSTFAAGIKRTHYHYSSIKHLARLLTSFLCWNGVLRLVVLQFMGRFNRRDRTGRFDVVAGYGALARSSLSVVTHAAFCCVRTHRGVFGIRGWAR